LGVLVDSKLAETIIELVEVVFAFSNLVEGLLDEILADDLEGLALLYHPS